MTDYRICPYPGCELPPSKKAGRGLCHNHYVQEHARGNLDKYARTTERRTSRIPQFPMTPVSLNRFHSKVERAETGCWEWVAYVSPNGYGVFKHGKNLQAHRASYMHYVGPIPPELELDHLCRNRRCVNPEHLEPVTAQINTLRSANPPAQNARKTVCASGHPFTPENTRVEARGGRTCLQCERRTVTCSTCGTETPRANRARHIRQHHGGNR